MVGVGRDLRHHVVSLPCHRQGHPPLDEDSLQLALRHVLEQSTGASRKATITVFSAPARSFYYI